jgi:sugar/nucleoside kinase (ribokinase family)
MIPGYLHHHGVKTITLDPSIRYMSPDFRKELPTLLHGINAFLPSLQEAAAFIANRGLSQWEIADLFHQMGPELVVLKAGANGQYLSDAQRDKRWHIPAYPTQIRDVTGAGDAFCGAFMVGLVETQDALEATLRGNISASFVVEGTGALYALDAPAHLRDARREALKNMVREE